MKPQALEWLTAEYRLSSLSIILHQEKSAGWGELPLVLVVARASFDEDAEPSAPLVGITFTPRAGQTNTWRIHLPERAVMLARERIDGLEAWRNERRREAQRPPSTTSNDEPATAPRP